jgi:hypothetical protein
VKRSQSAGLVLLSALLGACESAPAGPDEANTSLSLQIVAVAAAVSSADQGRIRIDGPSSSTRTVALGDSVKFTNLQPGTYTVVLEALAQGAVEAYGESTFPLAAGDDRRVSVILQSFVTSSVNAPEEVVVNEPLSVTWGAVSGATSYQVEWDDEAGFGSPQTTQASGTSASITPTVLGMIYLRVRAVNRFGAVGVASQVASALTTPPAPVKLTPGVPVGVSGDQGSENRFTVDVPAGGGGNRVLQLRTKGGTGDGDLYVRFGAEAGQGAFDCASTLVPDDAYENLDFCSVVNPAAGTWHVMVHGYEAFEGLTLDANLETSDAVTFDTPKGGLSANRLDMQYFTFTLPAQLSPLASSAATGTGSGRIVAGSDVLPGGKGGGLRWRGEGAETAPSAQGVPVPGQLQISIEGGTGDADLLAIPASLFGFGDMIDGPCASGFEGNVDVCDITDPEAGDWTAVLLAFEAFADVSLHVTYVEPSGMIEITKTIESSSGGVPDNPPNPSLAGFEFEIRDAQNQALVETVVTDANGLASAVVPEGSYDIVESDDQGLTDVTGVVSRQLVGGTVAAIDWTNRQDPLLVPPTITRYEVTAGAVSGCGVGFQDAATEEELDYADVNGDFPTMANLVETVGQPPSGIDSELRFEGEANFHDFSYDKDWILDPSSDGFNGVIRDNGVTCFNLNPTTTYVDFRVRVQDASGLWSDWAEARFLTPAAAVAAIDLTPGTMSLTPPDAVQYVATARDMADAVIPGIEFNWLNHNPAMGSVDPSGLYAVPAGAVGLDRIWAEAGDVWASTFIWTPGARDLDSAWWAPCVNWPGLSRAQGTWQHYRMTVQAGREYRFYVEPDGGSQTATGDPDLYLRWGAKPDLTNYDALSVGASGQMDEITWTAPSDGVVWISVYAYTTFSNVRFGEGNGCGDPTPVGPPSPAAPTDTGFAPVGVGLGPRPVRSDGGSGRSGNGVRAGGESG